MMARGSQMVGPGAAAVLVMSLAAAVSAAATLNATAGVVFFAVVILVGAGVLVWHAKLLDPWALLLVGLVSANYNVLLNANAFIAGGADRGKMITTFATAGFALFALAQERRRRQRGIEFQPALIDGLFAAILLAASMAFVSGLRAGNPQVYLLGDYGQLIQVVLAYAAVRLFFLVEGAEGMRTFLVLLAVSWGLRAIAELLFPEARGTAVIVLEGQMMFRRTDPLGPLGIPLLIGLLLSERHPARATLLAGSCLLVMTQNLLGFTRAHYLALGVALPLLLLVSLTHVEGRGRLTQAAPFVGLLAIVAYTVIAPIQGTTQSAWSRLQDAFDPNTQSRIHREAEQDAVLTHIDEAAFTGHGLGAEYVGVDPYTLRPAVVHFIHNDYLALWLRGGVLLVSAWTAMMAYSVWCGLRRQSLLGPLVAAGAAAGLVAMGVTALGSGSAFGYVAGPVTALLAATATYRQREVAVAQTRAASAQAPAWEVPHAS
ncbi:MAG: hypothetical protein WEB04_08510 [Dehalococcoidia bacterium]